MEQADSNAVIALKAAKSQSLTYYEATQTLLKQGFTQSEIRQASYQFPYTEISAPDQNSQAQLTSTDSQELGEAIVKEKALDHLREERDNAYLKSALFGRYVPLYNINATRAWANYAAAKNGKSKSKVYTAWFGTMVVCTLIFPLSGLLLIKLRLSPYLLITSFITGMIGIRYMLNRYLRIKD